MNPINLFRNADNQKSYAPGDVIFRKGDRGNYMYVVMEGEVDIVLDGAHIRTLEPGSFVGIEQTTPVMAYDMMLAVGADAEIDRRLTEDIERGVEFRTSKLQRAARIAPAIGRHVAGDREGTHVAAGRTKGLRRADRHFCPLLRFISKRAGV